MPPQIDFIQQNTLRSQYKVTLPNKVADRLSADQKGEALQARWNLNEDNKDVVISTEDMEENTTIVKDFTKINETETSVVIPERVRNLLNIENAEDKEENNEEGDDVYFIGMSDGEYPISAVLFWTLERMEEILIGGNKDQSYDYLRVPEFV
jgi:hypothetical protein